MSVFEMNIQIEDGMLVRVGARPNLHNKYGFSLVVEKLTASGEGSLRRAFELTKSKLQAEGLFSTERKRSLPRFPETIGLVTSAEAAAFTDITKLLETRWPIATIVHADTLVQGADAVDSLIKAIERLAGTKVEVIIIARGGGSLEDLSAFNDERLVRVIASSRIPTVVGVGHERDVTLAELVADLAATTPTNAAQLATPDAKQLIGNISAVPKTLLNLQKTRLDNLTDKLGYFVGSLTGKNRELIARLIATARHLEAYNPQLVLKKGYAVVRKSGRVVKSSAELSSGDTIKTTFVDGDINSEVTNG